MTTRPQKVTNLRDAENRKISTWIPPNGDGIGLWRGRRVYYVNGKRQSGLTIRNPIGDSVGNITKGLLIDGAKLTYGGVKNTSNALLGMASPWNLAAMGRTKKNIAQLGVKPTKKQSKEVLENIARNQAKLMTEGFGTELTETKPFENRVTSDKQVAANIVNKDKEDLEEIKNQLTDPKDINKAAAIEQTIKDNSGKVKTGFPAEVSEVEKQKGRTRWVGANTTWKDRWGNVIAPKVKGPTLEEQKKMIMTSLEQEMYD